MTIDLGPNAITSSSAAPKISRPLYLVTLLDGKAVTHFIATDKPELSEGFISVRGIYCELSEEEIVKTFSEIVSKSPKDTVLEMMFPTHRVKHIRSLVFNAVKPTMVSR